MYQNKFFTREVFFRLVAVEFGFEYEDRDDEENGWHKFIYGIKIQGFMIVFLVFVGCICKHVNTPGCYLNEKAHICGCYDQLDFILLFFEIRLRMVH